MSAINQQPSLIDRAGELRTDPTALAELLKRAKVLTVSGGKVSADLAGAKLLYPNAQVTRTIFLALIAQLIQHILLLTLPSQKVYSHCAKLGQHFHH